MQFIRTCTCNADSFASEKSVRGKQITSGVITECITGFDEIHKTRNAVRKAAEILHLSAAGVFRRIVRRTAHEICTCYIEGISISRCLRRIAACIGCIVNLSVVIPDRQIEIQLFSPVTIELILEGKI
jgi:hypothetical protein